MVGGLLDGGWPAWHSHWLPLPLLGPPLAAGLPGAASVACLALTLASVTASGATPGRWPARRGVGGLPGTHTGFRYRFWGHPWPLACPARRRWPAWHSHWLPLPLLGPPLAAGLPGAASVACLALTLASVTASGATPGRWPARRGVGGLPGTHTGFRYRFWGHPWPLACPARRRWPAWRPHGLPLPLLGPPLAAGLPGTHTGFRYRFWGHPLWLACGTGGWPACGWPVCAISLSSHKLYTIIQ